MSWVQLMFIGASLPGLLKGLLVTLNAILFAWFVVSTVRRIPAVARVV